ncbi:hypothetical protein ACH5RR_005745 [Cinchona calisaya]|uniref:Uncharacterized protein n=1 Tax=Cinchona calisaya TaxID=153742 RepID=A0ABD3AM26_9GENT
MAPKSWPPRRTPRTTARKSVPYKCTTTTSNLNKTTSSSSSSDTPPPPSSATATATSCPEFPSNDTGLLTSPSPDSNIANSDHKPHEKGEIDSVGDKEVPEEGNVENSDSSVAGLSCCEAKDGILVGPTSGVVEGGVPAEIEGSINDVAGGTSSVGETAPGVEVNADGGPQVKGKAAGDGALDEGVDKAASRTGKVVKKVRIVKKIVKRRVPKRFVKGSVGNEQVVRLENGGGNNPIEENVNNLEAEKVDHNGSFLMETENPKPNHTVALGVENEDSKEIKTEVMECRNWGFL